MLAGNWPYYTGEPHPGDEMLTARLHFSTRSENDDRYEKIDRETEDESSNNPWKTNGGSDEGRKGLADSTRCKLECLSSGLEGRQGGRPLALLMDHLQHPCVDTGFDVPSLLTWKSVEQRSEHKVIDHVVLGKGQAGGSWQSMDPNVLTISLNRWMSMPDLDIREWEALIESEQFRRTNASDGEPYACKTASRVSVGTVAAYYRDYVRLKRLEQYFRCGTIVTSVRPSENRSNGRHDCHGWTVDGFEMQTGRPFRYRCKRVVLATGTTDLTNRLGVPGEDSHPDWVTHDLNELESKLDRLLDRQHGSNVEGRQSVDPVLVIGAGLSAADAIIAARFRGIPVLHAFRDPSGELGKPGAEKKRAFYERLQGLPSSMYPEYHKVYEMMAEGGTNYPLYKTLPSYSLIGFPEDGTDRRVVTLSDSAGHVHAFRVSVVAILIGYKPDLSYLEAAGIGLGKYPDKPIDCKSNPIEVDDFTYEATKAPRSGLYALGPLVGDNFVRYVLGGAFGILVHILNSSSPT
ncbi:oxidative stress-induced growth inhibitor 1-like isoform X2 [Ceratina calcarata]|nr:oxidative stress-induced growth inhibitor 1-like isoform X2 [Ceratina calcarata]